MILNYSFPEFEKLITSGQKNHTIRKPGRWKAGMIIHHSYGSRTKNYRCFLVNKCTGVQKIEFRYPAYKMSLMPCHLFINNIERGLATAMTLSDNDGFKSAGDFFKFFNKSCVMEIVHWTDLRY